MVWWALGFSIQFQFPSVPWSFPNSIAEKLDDSNHLHWKQKIEPVIKSHKLQRFVENPTIPPCFLSDEDRDVRNVNPAYEVWEVQDQMLLTWLQLTLLKSILSCVLGSIHSYQVWDKIHKHFFTQTKARARQLWTDLHTTSLEGKTLCEFLSQIKNIADELANIGSPIQHEEYVDAILVGLPQDYAPVVSVIESKFETPTIVEVEVLLLAHESWSNRFSKKAFSPSMNYTQPYVNPNYSNSHDAGGYACEMLVIVATLIVAVATMVVVSVEVTVAGLQISSVRSVSNMTIQPMSVITDLTPPISLMNLWCCMILLHCNLCSIVAQSLRLILSLILGLIQQTRVRNNLLLLKLLLMQC